MWELSLVVIALCLGCLFGNIGTRDNYQAACVAKYADMPHNQVEEHCKKILKFEK